MHPMFSALFAQHAAASLDKQFAFLDLIGESDWSFDMDGGRLAFGRSHVFDVQLLGSESEYDQTWLWAWANEESQIPDSLLKSSLALRNFGEQKQIPELTEPKISLEDVSGDVFAMLASGACQGNAYYRGPYDGGALYMLVKDSSYPTPLVEGLFRIMKIFPRLISHYPLNHLKAFQAYVKYYKLPTSVNGRTILVGDPSGGHLSATFDDQDRLGDLTGNLTPESVAPKPMPRPRRRRRRR